VARCTVFPEVEYCSFCTTDKENNMTTLTAPRATSATVEIEKTVKVKEKQFTLTVSEQQAGYLQDAIKSHLAGEVRAFLSPIADALYKAGAARQYAKNDNTYDYTDGYSYGHAILKFKSTDAREAATGSRVETGW
jgi:hypothetical protein